MLYKPMSPRTTGQVNRSSAARARLTIKAQKQPLLKSKGCHQGNGHYL